MDKNSRIYIAGHRGLAGSAITRHLEAEGYTNLIKRTHAELDLTRQTDVDDFFTAEKPEYVFLAAAKVGGIFANNTQRGDFIRENLLMQTFALDAAYRNGAKKLIFLGSSCIYPKLAPQPMREEDLLTGTLEPTNEPYAIAKIAGLKMGQAYRSQYGFNAITLMPTNLYGPGDNFNLENSHVLPALLRKLHEAKLANAPEAIMWGTGSPLREFMHSDDLASAAVYLMEHDANEDIFNVGTGEEITIRDLVRLIATVVGYQGKIVNDSSKPDGTPRKLLDVSRLSRLGWKAKIPLEEGIRDTYSWYSHLN